MTISDDLSALIWSNFAHQPTLEQKKVVNSWCEFLLSRAADDIFLLSGYAGTGKTSLLGALVKTMQQLKQPVVLLAPTGRAAKVFASYAEYTAQTIHKKIYRQKSVADMDSFQPNSNLHKHTLFIVDEASMIANEGLSGATFGTGRLLDDLIQYVYSGEGCRLMLVGDRAQLPPVGEEESPALNADAVAGYGLPVVACELTEVVRQVHDSGILWNATQLRRMIEIGDTFEFPKLRTAGFPDVKVLPGDELIEALEDSFYHCGKDETIVVTRSNKRANIYNNGIRNRILGYEEELSGGDLVIVAKNNYYYTLNEPEAPTSEEDARPAASSFVANGDTAVVRRYRNLRTLYGFRFVDALLQFPDYDNMEIEATVLLDTLQSEAPALTREQQEHLFQQVWDDYPEITNKRDRIKKIKEDVYYNALQIKYSYAITCHKAQGGQWEHVYIDQGYITEDMICPDYFRWLYTAITRATKKVFLVNWREEQLYNATFAS